MGLRILNSEFISKFAILVEEFRQYVERLEEIKIDTSFSENSNMSQNEIEYLQGIDDDDLDNVDVDIVDDDVEVYGNDVDNVDYDVEGIDDAMDNVDYDVEGIDDDAMDNVDYDVEGIDDDAIDNVDYDVEGIDDNAIDNVDYDVEGIDDDAMDNVDYDVDSVDDDVDSVDDDVDSIEDDDVDSLDDGVDSIEDDVDSLDDGVDSVEDDDVDSLDDSVDSDDDDVYSDDDLDNNDANDVDSVDDDDVVDSADDDLDNIDEFTDDSDSDASYQISKRSSLHKRIPRFKIIYALAHYHPNAQVQNALQKDFSAKALEEISETFRIFLKDGNLDQNNFHEILQTLLQIEDVTRLAPFPDLAQYNANLVFIGDREYYVELQEAVHNIDSILVPQMDEAVVIPVKLAPTMSARSIDILRRHDEEQVVKQQVRRRIGNITKIERSRVYFQFSNDEVRGLVSLGTKFHVIFRPHRMPLRYQYRAINLLSKSPGMRLYLFPGENPAKKLPALRRLDFTLINYEIASNPEQLQAVRHIVAGYNSYAPYIIFGPPGTGKTTTIVECILQLRLQKPGSRILVTASSNSACDTIAIRICQYLQCNELLKRILTGRTEVQRLYAPSALNKRFQDTNSMLLQYSNFDKRTNHMLPTVDILQKYGIIIATLCTVGKLVTGDIGGEGHFTHVFIDEAGASSEPETLVGMMGIKSAGCRIILSGDHKQLGPVLKSKLAIKLGLERSMMERLLARDCYALDKNGNYDITLQARLRRNYRSHPEIVNIYNHLYYNDELIPQREPDGVFSNWPILANPNFPIIFQAVHGRYERDESSSSYNELEIEVLMWYLERLLCIGVNGKLIRQQDIGVITPYKEQCKRIQRILAKRYWHGVEAGTVEAFQGREKPIIVASLVRSFSGLGFVTDKRRLNVLLSRAKSLLIIMGNPITLRRNKDFEFIIKTCKVNGTLRRKKRNKVCKRGLTTSSDSFSSTSDSSEDESLEEKMGALSITAQKISPVKEEEIKSETPTMTLLDLVKDCIPLRKEVEDETPISINMDKVKKCFPAQNEVKGDTVITLALNGIKKREEVNGEIPIIVPLDEVKKCIDLPEELKGETPITLAEKEEQVKETMPKSASFVSPDSICGSLLQKLDSILLMLRKFSPVQQKVIKSTSTQATLLDQDEKVTPMASLEIKRYTKEELLGLNSESNINIDLPQAIKKRRLCTPEDLLTANLKLEKSPTKNVSLISK